MTKDAQSGPRPHASVRRPVQDNYRALYAAAGQRSPRATHLSIHPKGRLEASLADGTILIGSDPHYWPGLIAPAHEAFVRFADMLQPDIIVLNGDVFDGAGISRFPPMNWEEVPTVAQQIEAARDRLREIELAAPRARRIWPLGNHDSRFERKLASDVPEYRDITGVHLKDHIASWEPCWSLFINDDVVVKHRLKGGIHAAHNNTLWSGKTIVTGHLHRLKVHPHTDYGPVRWGIESGMLGDPTGPQFSEYTEDNPLSWQPGFILLTFHHRRLLWPEVIHVRSDDGQVEWRGSVLAG